MQASLDLPNTGFKVYLVEKEKELGGMIRQLKQLNKLYFTNRDPSEFLKPLLEKVAKNKKIKVLTERKIENIEGYIGNYTVTLSDQKEKLKVGTIIVATGAIEYKPNLYGYGKNENVITQLQLEKLLKAGKLPNVNNIIIIQCVGARGQVLSYCSRICCVTQ